MINNIFNNIFYLFNSSCYKSGNHNIKKEECFYKNLNKNINWEEFLFSDQNQKQLNEINNISKIILNYILNDSIIKKNYKELLELEKEKINKDKIFLQNCRLDKLIDRMLILENDINLNIKKTVFVSIQKYNDNELCCICMTNSKNIAYVNCGHLCVCNKCIENEYLENKNIKNKWINKCPICKIKGKNIKIWR